jgi:predicted Zn finger-like uncharacterized protein
MGEKILIVQCEHCQTKYRIADEKVKGKGVKVRCAKCENVFTVTAPEEAAAPPPSAPPAPEPPAPDPPGPDPVAQSAELPPLGAPPSVDAAAPGVPPLPDTGAPATDGPLGAYEPPSSDEGLGDLGAPSLGRPAHEQDRNGEPQAPAAADPGLPDLGGFELEGTMREGTDDGLGNLPDLSGSSAQPSPDTAVGGGDWGNISIGGGAAPEESGDDFGIASAPDYVPPPPTPLEEGADPMAPPVPHDTSSTATSAVPSYEPEAASSKGGRKGLVLILFLAVLGAGGYFAYPKVKPIIMKYVKSGAQESAGTLTPANIQVKPLQRNDGKEIFTVRGEVRNESAGTVGMIQVEAQFRNAADEVIGRAEAFCGNIIEDSTLAGTDMGRIKADLNNELGQSLSNASIPAGGKVPFLIVLDNPPAGVSKVTVTISNFQETTL